jgi:methylated-DNA-[protein]-cysteine S-methyltransferase
MKTTDIERELKHRFSPLLREAPRRSKEAADRISDAAAARGLLDLAYGFADSPFGRLLLVVSGRGLVRVGYPDRDVDNELEELAALISPRILESARSTDRVRKELDQYFDGMLKRFTVPVDLSVAQGFRRRVLEATALIPFGSVSTYREVAEKAGSPRATRAAGNALGSNPIPIVVPCHRVVRTGGGLGGYTGGLDRKVKLLTIEGVLDPA